MNEQVLNQISAEIAGKEREIVNEFCKTYMASCSLEGISFKEMAEKIVLNIQHDFTNGMLTKYWIEWKGEAQ